MKIKMLYGTYGYRKPDGVMEAKDASSPPFEVREEDGERLVGMGYAEPAGKGMQPGEEAITPYTAGGWEGTPMEGGIDSPPDRERLELMVKRDLEKLAKEMGLPYSGTREEIITRIYNAEMEEYEGGQSGYEGGIPGLPDMEGRDEP